MKGCTGTTWILEKFEWGESIHTIDWESHKKAHNTLPPDRRSTVSNVLFNWLPTNARLFSWVPPQHPHPFCPTCKNTIETHDHIFQCGHPIAQTAQVQSLERIRTWGKKRKLYPLMLSIFFRYLHTWMRQITIDMSHRLLEHNQINRSLKKAIIEQNKIG